MWSYLKSDLEELVNVVKEDTGIVFEKTKKEDPQNVANNNNQPPSAAMKEALRRMNEEETYTVPLFQLPPSSSSPSDEKNTPTGTGTSDAADVVPGNDNDIVSEKQQQQQHEATTGLDDDDTTTITPEENALVIDSLDLAEAMAVEAFRTSFQIDTRTDEIAALLALHPDTLQIHFATLVPELVPYHDFWERFFYRCDEGRVEQEWAAEDDRARRARAELVGSVSNFLGAALAKATAVVAPTTKTAVVGKPSSSSTPFDSIFGKGGRPPFVMNTAVDEDDDEEGEEEVEEELGWDDEDEDEDDTDGDQGVDDSGKDRTGDTTNIVEDDPEEQIVFKDEALDAIAEQLKQAIAERDQLHETVNLQAQNIASLKASSETTKEEMDALRHEVNLKTKELTTSQVKVTTQNETAGDSEFLAKAEVEMERMAGLLASKDLELSQMEKTFTTRQNELESNLADAMAKNDWLVQEKSALTEDAILRLAEATTRAQEAAQTDAELTLVQDELRRTNQSLFACKNENDSLKLQLLEQQQQWANAQQDLLLVRQSYPAESNLRESDGGEQNRGIEEATPDVAVLTTATVPTTDQPSTATGDAAAVAVTGAVVSKITANNEEDEEGWGDDWD